MATVAIPRTLGAPRGDPRTIGFTQVIRATQHEALLRLQGAKSESNIVSGAGPAVVNTGARDADHTTRLALEALLQLSKGGEDAVTRRSSDTAAHQQHERTPAIQQAAKRRRVQSSDASSACASTGDWLPTQCQRSQLNTTHPLQPQQAQCYERHRQHARQNSPPPYNPVARTHAPPPPPSYQTTTCAAASTTNPNGKGKGAATPARARINTILTRIDPAKHFPQAMSNVADGLAVSNARLQHTQPLVVGILAGFCSGIQTTDANTLAPAALPFLRHAYATVWDAVFKSSAAFVGEAARHRRMCRQLEGSMHPARWLPVWTATVAKVASASVTTTTAGILTTDASTLATSAAEDAAAMRAALEIMLERITTTVLRCRVQTVLDIVARAKATKKRVVNPANTTSVTATTTTTTTATATPAPTATKAASSAVTILRFSKLVLSNERSAAERAIHQQHSKLTTTNVESGETTTTAMSAQDMMSVAKKKTVIRLLNLLQSSGAKETGAREDMCRFFHAIDRKLHTCAGAVTIHTAALDATVSSVARCKDVMKAVVQEPRVQGAWSRLLLTSAATLGCSKLSGTEAVQLYVACVRQFCCLHMEHTKKLAASNTL